MRLDPPRWWYGGRSTAAAALKPVAFVYGAIGELRFRVTPLHRAGVPVICVGNFTMGGAGKTPTAIALARLLQEIGRTPGFLTRGYGGTEKGPHQVDPAGDNATRVGDEPLLLARHAPTFVSRNRPAGAEFIERHGCDCIVMDDGFQNPSLHKDFSLIVMDGGAGVGNGCVFPAGPLRAPLHRQLPRASAILILGGSRARRIALGARITGRPVLMAELRAEAEHDLAGRRVLAYCGIGRSSKFFQTLQEAGANVVRTESFADHHAYTDAEAAKLLADAAELKALLVTTEKDHARIAGATGRVGALRERSFALPVSVVFEEGDELRLTELLREALRARARSVQGF